MQPIATLHSNTLGLYYIQVLQLLRVCSYYNLRTTTPIYSVTESGWSNLKIRLQTGAHLFGRDALETIDGQCQQTPVAETDQGDGDQHLYRTAGVPLDQPVAAFVEVKRRSHRRRIAADTGIMIDPCF